jgi:hypothetical protein
MLHRIIADWLRESSYYPATLNVSIYLFDREASFSRHLLQCLIFGEGLISHDDSDTHHAYSKFDVSVLAWRSVPR